MKRNTTFKVLLALAAVTPAVFVPQLTTPAQAAAAVERAEYPDVPQGHWAYEALNALSRAGIIEGLPNGTYAGNKPMTRYEFAVAIARLLRQIPTIPNISGLATKEELEALRRSIPGPVTIPPSTTVDLGPLTNRVNGLDTRVGALDTRVTAVERGLADRPTRAEVNDLIAALRREFAEELANLGNRVTATEMRLSNLENVVAKPPRFTPTMSILHRMGQANYIENRDVLGVGGQGRLLINGNNGARGETAFPARPGANNKFSYTDFELRLTDRITDRLSVSGALRALGSTQEDAWTGEDVSLGGQTGGGFGGFSTKGGGIYAREAFATVDLSDRSLFSMRGLSASLGRQRRKVAQGLLYDNDLSPTDQIAASFDLGPFNISGFIGSTNNQTFGGSANPYISTGAVRYLGGFTGAGAPGFGVGFPTASVFESYPDDNEVLGRVGVNLFRIAGQPVTLGYSHLLEGVQSQRGDSFDLSLPLFNRVVGVEFVRQSAYFGAGRPVNENGGGTVPKAWNVTVPVLRSNILDLNVAYGKADDEFEFFVASAANPFARTYGEAIFDRPLMLGAPLINGAGRVGEPLYMAAKEGFDISGTLRLPIAFLRRVPLQFRYYDAEGTDGIDLGKVYSVGTTFNLSPGLDLELKYGEYRPAGDRHYDLRYMRVGANIGF